MYVNLSNKSFQKIPQDANQMSRSQTTSLGKLMVLRRNSKCSMLSYLVLPICGTHKVSLIIMSDPFLRGPRKCLLTIGQSHPMRELQPLGLRESAYPHTPLNHWRHTNMPVHQLENSSISPIEESNTAGISAIISSDRLRCFWVFPKYFTQLQVIGLG